MTLKMTTDAACDALLVKLNKIVEGEDINTVANVSARMVSLALVQLSDNHEGRQAALKILIEFIKRDLNIHEGIQ